MKKISVIIIILTVLFSMNACAQTMTHDVNQDGKPDITYYGDGKYVTKIEADTNYDGAPDVIVHTKDGKFLSAEVDTDHNGTMDKKFTDTKAFNKWMNENGPDFSDKLGPDYWTYGAIKF